MGWLSALFGGGRTKESLIRTLVKKRVSSDPSAAVSGVTPDAIDALSAERLMGLPEATVVMISEAWSQGKGRGLPEGQIFQLIEAHRSMAAKGDLPLSLTLESYIEYRVDLEHSDGMPVSVDHIEHCVREARKFFGYV